MELSLPAWHKTKFIMHVTKEVIETKKLKTHVHAYVEGKFK